MNDPLLDPLLDLDREWLEADGLGGFASGTAGGIRTRRYHALLLAAARPPAERFVLVNGLETTAFTAAGAFALGSQAYSPGVIHPDGYRRIAAFHCEPWPTRVHRLPAGTEISEEIVALHDAPAVVVRYRLLQGPSCTLAARPLMSGRDFHGLLHEGDGFGFEALPAAPSGDLPSRLRFEPRPGVPGIELRGNFGWSQAPDWYRGFLYREERDRGLDCVEDLASPGTCEWDLADGDAILLLLAETPGHEQLLLDLADLGAAGLVERERRRRAAFPTTLHRAADAYLVRRGEGRTIIAGYPWFGDWGRDTFIALRGLCLATGRLDDAGAILCEWARAVDGGLLPNRFPDRGEQPEYNSVDAALWFVVVTGEYLRARHERGESSADEMRRLTMACELVIDGLVLGTRHGIRVDEDGLLAAGAPGVQLTWMDAKVGDHVITPRVGKPVEVQALWLNALSVVTSWEPTWRRDLERGVRSFRERFWAEATGRLHDVVDADHVRGRVDSSFRPNQILAAGGLPFMPLTREQARSVVDAVERHLWTPLGLRTLAPSEPAYTGRYSGGVLERDGAYHQGTAWPWLLGPFIDAWIRARGGGAATAADARARFLVPLLAHRLDAGLLHVSEIVDADAPHAPRGAPFQAWSLSELLRIHAGEDTDACALTNLHATAGAAS